MNGLLTKLEENLLKLQENLYPFFKIESRVYKRRNGLGTIYYEMNINKQKDIKILYLTDY